MVFVSLFAPAFLAVAAMASPVKRAWPSGDVTCGSATYSLSQVKSATSAGYAQMDNPIGDSKSPPVLLLPFLPICLPDYCRFYPFHHQRTNHLTFFDLQ